MSDSGPDASPPPSRDLGDVYGMADEVRRLRRALTGEEDGSDFRPDEPGVLLAGAPGTGKTHLATAMAGELGVNVVEFIGPSGLAGELTEGSLAEFVDDAFAEAAGVEPCLVIADECEGLFRRDAGFGETMLEGLAEVSGSRVALVLTTMFPEEVSPPSLRENLVEVELPPPGRDDRIAILRGKLAERPVDVASVDWSTVADLTEGFTARDLELVVEGAAREVVKEARERDAVVPIEGTHVRAAIDDVDPELADRDRWP